MYIEIVVLEPPVSWFNTSSGRASASVTWTLSTGRSSSSAIIIAVEVVMPWPTSVRGQRERRGAVLVDRDRDQVGGRRGGVGQQVVEVVELRRLGRRGGPRDGRVGERQVGGGDQRGAAQDVAEEAAAPDPAPSGILACSVRSWAYAVMRPTSTSMGSRAYPGRRAPSRAPA